MTCKQCGSISENYYCLRCTDYRNEYKRKRYNEKEKVAAIALKLETMISVGGKCIDCFSPANSDFFDFHHREDENKEHELWYLFLKRRVSIIKEEIKKCDLLCANCHRTRHWQESKGSVAKKRGEIKMRLVKMLGGICKSCGKIHCPGVYDFHHNNNSNKLFGINEGIKQKRSWEELKREVKKCILLCVNCHRSEHNKDKYLEIRDIKRLGYNVLSNDQIVF